MYRRSCRFDSFWGLGFFLTPMLMTQCALYFFSHCVSFIGLFGFGFLAGVSSYKTTCVEKIMKLENSRLADQVRATQMWVVATGYSKYMY